MQTASSTWLQRLRESGRRAAGSWVFHLLASAVVILAVFAWSPPLFSGDTDTARNYLNTIVSSLSTILALCISIILVAIQLTASNYTHRVLDFFVRLPYNASLFLMYLVTIVHSFFLLTKVTDTVNEPLRADLRPEMSADLVLVVICFLSLLLYMYAVVQLLKPERIIDLIVREYNRAFARQTYRAALDNVEQICDIAKRAASFSDTVTGMRCMQVMLRIAARLPLPAQADDPLFEIHRNVVDQWVEIVGVAVKEKETGLLNGVLDALQAQGRLYVEGECWRAAELVIRAYRHLAFTHLLPEGHALYIERVANHLYALALCAARQSPRGQTFCVRTLQVITAMGEYVFAAEAAAPALVSGFLLADDFAAAVAQLAAAAEQRQAVALYFELWKSFAGVAPLRDLARWARWWEERLPDAQLRAEGRQLAALLAHHLGRGDLAATLGFVWQAPVDTLLQGPARHVYEPYRARLLDGWPWPPFVTATTAPAGSPAPFPLPGVPESAQPVPGPE
ncbi:MAG: DUF2254 domain-containing protein [Alicyclobacillus sp.]|nr:DUF2254 domain-containing protein [Alicyclobacillus sp.]